MAHVVPRGRLEPMATALGLIRKVMRTGQGGGLVITGEGGIGKSALLPAIVREAAQDGRRSPMTVHAPRAVRDQCL